MPPEYNDHQLHLQALIDAAVNAADPSEAVNRHLRKNQDELQVGSLIRKSDSGRVFLISVGKAALAMAEAAVKILGSDLTAGIVITKHNQIPSADDLTQRNLFPKQIRLFGAGHPISDQASLSATWEALNLLEDAADKDLLICLISGGASSLLTKPLMELEQWQLLVNKLLASGCTINELNTIRKRLDLVKGGGLARIASPAQCVSLILSDVVGNPLDMIGSGPTVQNPDSADKVWEVLVRYSVRELVPDQVWDSIIHALDQEAPAELEPFLEAENIIIGDVRQAAEAAASEAKRLGFETTILTAQLEGEAREVGKVAAAIAKDARAESAYVIGGETTVSVKGSGMGGRNQELALAAAIALNGSPKCLVASFATHGDDGPTDAAGAFATGETVSQAHFAGINPVLYLDNNDSYAFFSKIGGLIKTGPTGTNVNDLLFILKY